MMKSQIVNIYTGKMLYRTFSSLSKNIRMSQYNYALVRQIPKSIETEAVRMDETKVVDFTEAQKECQNYKMTLKKCGLKIIEVEKDEQYPDCLFVEDTAVVIGRRALINRLGHESRRGEIVCIKDALKKLNLDITEMTDEDGIVDGGDVLFTGKEILVGLSTRTNERGLQKLAKTFPQYHVTGIPVHSSVLHLKSIATMFGDEVIAVGGSSAAKGMYETLKTKAKFSYRYLELKNDQSSNGLFINGILVHKTKKELGDQDYETITSNIKGKRLETCLQELYKVDGCLTCCSLLINNKMTN